MFFLAKHSWSIHNLLTFLKKQWENRTRNKISSSNNFSCVTFYLVLWRKESRNFQNSYIDALLCVVVLVCKNKRRHHQLEILSKLFFVQMFNDIPYWFYSSNSLRKLFHTIKESRLYVWIDTNVYFRKELTKIIAYFNNQWYIWHIHLLCF